MASVVSVVFTKPETVLDDYRRVMELASWNAHLRAERELLLKLNLSWTKYFPACSSQPWQVDGVVRTLVGGGYAPDKIIPVENKTVVTNPRKGARNNCWIPVLERHGSVSAADGSGLDGVPVQIEASQAQRYLSQGIEIP